VAPAAPGVTNISGVPRSAYQNADHTFYAVVSPGDATKKTPINWQVLSGSAQVRNGGGNAFILHISSATSALLRATIPGGGANQKDYTQDFTVTLDTGPSIIDGGGSGGSGGIETIRFVKENNGSSSMYTCWIYTMDSRYDKRFNNSQLASGNSGIAVDGAISYFKPPAGLTLYKEVSNLHKVMVNRGDYFEIKLPSDRYLITWLKTSVAYHYGYDKQNWFVLDIPYQRGNGSPIEIKVDTTGPDCTMRF
jgi:hypothetical protein